AGLGIQTGEGHVLTLVDRVAHHFTAGISTVEIAAQNVDRLNSEFQKFYRNNEKINYALSGGADKIEAVKDLLDRHEINYAMAQKGKVKGYNYGQKKNSELQVNENTLVVTTAQPKGKMVKVLFEPSTKLVDSLTYDITAWSLPYAYGLDAVATDRNIATVKAEKPIAVTNTADPAATG
ncbi:hypothetical protein, partial [Longispora fulva]